MTENKSLKDNQTTSDKIDELILAMKSNSGNKIVWVLVEGINDCRTFTKFVDERFARVEFVPGGKYKAEEALNKLLEISKKVICIRDADFMNLEGKRPSNNNIFLTDYHDIEMTMLSFESLRSNLYSEHFSFDFEGVWQNIIEQASYMGYVRWMNHKNDSKVRLEGFGYADVFSIDNIILKRGELLDKINKQIKEDGDKITEQKVENFREEFYTRDLLNLCNGHDVVALIALLIGHTVSSKELHRHIRISFRREEFVQTKLHDNLLHWQTRSGYKVLTEK